MEGETKSELETVEDIYFDIHSLLVSSPSSSKSAAILSHLPNDLVSLACIAPLRVACPGPRGIQENQSKVEKRRNERRLYIEKG